MTETYHVPFRFKISRPLLILGFRALFHVLAKVKVSGRQNVPVGKPYVIAMNHVSIFDPPFVASSWPEQAEIIGASDVFDRKGQGLILKAYGVIPAHRGEYDRPLFMRIISAIKAGYPLLIAPEGTRSHVPGMRRAMPGVSYIIEQTNVPVIPVGIVGSTEDFWQRGKRGEKPPIEMRIGKPIHLPEIMVKGKEKHEARQANADLVMRHLAGMLPEEYRGVYADSAIPPA